jgi:hypothetical protein
VKLLHGIGCLIATLLISSCASTDRVVFVTSTEIGIGADPSIGSVNFGFDRNELVLSPGYPETGAVPPVYARLETDMAVINPSAKQLYATGDAARAAVGVDLTNDDFKDELYGERRLLVFGTATNFGLKVQSLNAEMPSVNLGYKRKEFSMVPLREKKATKEKQDKYASVLASIDLRSDINNASSPDVEGHQFIATGSAARKLASTKPVRELFNSETQKALAYGDMPVDNDLQAAVLPICSRQGERKSNSQLDKQLKQIEDKLGYGIAEFCLEPTQTKLDQLSSEMKQANLL